MDNDSLFLDEIQKLQECIGYSFSDIGLLKMALTHESYANEHEADCGDNERLEFLGDSVLGMAVCLYLYERHPKASEGSMAQVKGFVASTAFLADKARQLRLGDYLRMGNGERASNGGNKSNVLADAMEALIGAIYLDGGFVNAQNFIYSLLQTAMDNMEGSRRDYKSLFQEVVQKHFHILPVYKVVEESGPAHDKYFVIELSFNGCVMGRGEGKTKQIAGQGAAKQALAVMYLKFGFDLDIKNDIVLDDSVL
ncbi:ribonuclease III [bacterium]|nr:ribonuclease III [bacterium]